MECLLGYFPMYSIVCPARDSPIDRRPFNIQTLHTSDKNTTNKNWSIPDGLLTNIKMAIAPGKVKKVKV
jgi:hypothetical protein